jgi:hypothetical protein
MMGALQFGVKGRMLLEELRRADATVATYNVSLLLASVVVAAAVRASRQLALSALLMSHIPNSFSA